MLLLHFDCCLNQVQLFLVNLVRGSVEDVEVLLVLEVDEEVVLMAHGAAEGRVAHQDLPVTTPQLLQLLLQQVRYLRLLSNLVLVDVFFDSSHDCLEKTWLRFAGVEDVYVIEETGMRHWGRCGHILWWRNLSTPNHFTLLFDFLA